MTTRSRLFSPTPGMLEVLAYCSCTPSVLYITCVKDIKNSILLFMVCELFSCNDNSHSGVAVRYDVSDLSPTFATSAAETYLKLGGESGLLKQIPHKMRT